MTYVSTSQQRWATHIQTLADNIKDILLFFSFSLWSIKYIIVLCFLKDFLPLDSIYSHALDQVSCLSRLVCCMCTAYLSAVVCISSLNFGIYVISVLILWLWLATYSAQKALCYKKLWSKESIVFLTITFYSVAHWLYIWKRWSVLWSI